jgi:hypothetical protein
MGIGENPKKIQNIVSANLAGFRGLYKPLLASVLDGSGRALSHAYSFWTLDDREFKQFLGFCR